MLPASLDELRVGAWKDPWGNRYEYINLESGEVAGLARRDSRSNPLNRDYDLFSPGRDGDTESSISNPVSRDDVIRALGGNFFGSASEYPNR